MSKTLKSIIGAIAVAFAALFALTGVSHAQSACKGLSKSACERNDSCSHVKGFTRSDGVKVSAFCRAKPGNGSTAKKASTKKKKTSTTKKKTAKKSDSSSAKPKKVKADAKAKPAKKKKTAKKTTTKKKTTAKKTTAKKKPAKKAKAKKKKTVGS